MMLNRSSGRVRSFAALACFLVLTACGGDGEDAPVATATQVVASEVPNEQSRFDIRADATEPVVLKVSSELPGLKGTTMALPSGAVIEDAMVQVGYEDALPAQLSAEAQAAGTTQVSKVLVLKMAEGRDSTFNLPVVVTMPYDTTVADGLPPAVFVYDEQAQRYQAVSVIKVDREAGTVSFRTSHFSKFVAMVVLNLRIGAELQTDFVLGTDSILHQNFGSYQYGGHCAAFTSLSTYYFRHQGAKRLYAFAQEGGDEQPADDEITRSALAMTYGVIAAKWASVAGSIVVPDAADTGLLMLQSMIVTGQPLHLVMHSGNPTNGGHAVTVYGYDADAQAFRVYDPNFPKTEVRFPWMLGKGFGVYSRAASYPAAMFDHIGYATDDTYAAPAQLAQIVNQWKSGKLPDLFNNLRITNPKDNVTTVLDVKSELQVGLPYADGQTVQGQFMRPAGSTRPVFVHVYIDGVKQGDGALLPADGRFAISFPRKLENKADVMLLVTEHVKSLTTGFSGFGRFSVKPEGKNFFVNFGFETGDLTGWSAMTSREGVVFVPTKATVVGQGFDGIATDLPLSVFGGHAVRVNDEDNGYHVTYVQQRATVPSQGNPQLRFQWAAVLQDPQHDPAEQPYVEVVVRNVSKGSDLYRKRFYTNDPTFTGWKDYQDGNWKAIPWQAVVVTGLAASAGDEIELTVVGADCGLGGHGGYVYLDGEE
jgi:hypothetical protein